MPNKLSGKKKRQRNKNKQKANIIKTSSRKAIINSLESFDKKELLVSILATKTSESRAKNINIAIISVDTYCIAYYFKKV